MRRFVSGFLAVAVLAVAAPQGQVQGQIIWGAHVPYAVDVFDGAAGIGGRVGWDLPVLPIDIVGIGEYFFPDCGAEDCSYWGAAAEVNLRLPIPIVRPYVLGGIVYRSGSNLDLSGEAAADVSGAGVSAGAGIDFNLIALRVFLDARYEFMEETELEQTVVRLGVVF